MADGPQIVGLMLKPRTLPFVWLVVLASTAISSMLLAVIFTSVNMLRHKRENQHPLLQKYTMRILFMVPLYSVTSSISLLVRQHNLTQVIECMRMLFETVVIFSFLQYILVCAGGVKALICRFEKTARKPKKAEKAGKLELSSTLGRSATCPSLGSLQGLAAAGGAAAGRRSLGADPEDNYSSDESGASDDAASSSRTTTDHSASEGESVAAVTLDLAMGGNGALTSSSESDCPESGLHVVSHSSHLRKLRHLPLLDRCLPPWRSARQMLKWCIRGTLSYIIVGICYVVVRVVLFSIASASGEGEHLTGKGAVMMVAQGFLVASQGCAITALTTLGVNMMEDLKPLHGHWKFLSVKLVIFFTFWQGLVLVGLQSLGALQPMVDQALHWSSPKDVAVSFQNWLICLEMLIASVLHFKVWPPHDYLIMLAHIEMRRDRLDSVDTQMSAPRTLAVDLRDIYETAESVMRVRSIPE